jgi:hypothetical protein
LAKLVNPNLFSKKFGLPPDALEKAGLIDPILNCDTKLFIDPLLIATSNNKIIRERAYALLKERFGNVVRLLAVSEKPGDVAWRAAAQLLDLAERPETCLGYGGSGIGGSSRPDEIRQKVLHTGRDIIRLGAKDPEIISLMGLFEEGVGPDTISDLTTNATLPALCRITSDFCEEHRIRTRRFRVLENANLPENPFRRGAAVVLVPSDVVRELPLAADWADVSRVAFEIAAIRKAFNALIGDIAKATLSEKKRALKRAALESLATFRQLFDAVLGASNHYDPNTDVLNFYAFRQLMASDLAPFKVGVSPVARPGRSELRRVVSEIVAHFKRMVEDNNLWEMLWDGERPKRERAAQLLFFAVSDLFCKANNIDISPETNMGGGPVDFKFSSGYANRLLVEIKLSKGTVVHGYEKQLETYKTAARTDEGVFVVIHVGNLGNKVATIQAMRERALKRGQAASEIVVVDGRRKPSASKS